MKRSGDTFEATEIEVLESWEAIRKRPAMYIGNLENPKIPIELVKDTLCEARAAHRRGKATHIQISAFPKGVGGLSSDRMQVIDDGPGWPIDVHKTGKRVPELLLTQLAGCREFKEVGDKEFCNAGIVVVNALCSSFEFTTWRDGRAWSQRYEGGRPVTAFTDNGDSAGVHGTQFFFSLDETLLPHTLPSEEDLNKLAEELRGDGLRVDVSFAK